MNRRLTAFERPLYFATLLATTLGMCSGNKSASAQGPTTQTVYNNTSTNSGYYYPNGGATATSLTTFTEGSLINLGVGATGQISSFTASLNQGNSVAVTLTPIFTFYAAGSNGFPSTVIATDVFGTFSFAASSRYTLTVSNLNLNLGTSFWAAETFTSTTATAAQLNALGMNLFGPPTFGTGGGTFFISSSNADYNVSNPGGTDYDYPAASGIPNNFYFSFTGLSGAPEPSSVALALSSVAVFAGGLIRRRCARA